jgi:lysophospholipid acyltransferase (LPLAT)-like uncharacterized protein
MTSPKVNAEESRAASAPSPPDSQSSRVAPDRPKSSGVVVPHAPLWYQRLAAWVIYGLIRVVSASLRFRWNDRSGHFEQGSAGPTIYCIWHNRLALSMPAYFHYARKRNQTSGLAAMVSASKDGAFLAGILECFGVQPVRGSSSRRGPQALLELVSWTQRGYDVAITPDGPRGPRYVVQEGVMSLAQLTGLPILPCSFHLSWKIQANSWDRFQIPLPFARCEMRAAPPLRVPREASEAEREALRRQLEQTLKDLSRD